MFQELSIFSIIEIISCFTSNLAPLVKIGKKKFKMVTRVTAVDERLKEIASKVN